MGHGIRLSEIVEKMDLKCLNPEVDTIEKEVNVPDINRPALQLAGFFDHFDSSRVQIIGNVEYKYVQTLSHERRMEIFNKLLDNPIPCFVFCRDIEPEKEFLDIATTNGIPVYRTAKQTSDFTAEIIRWMNVRLAPCISIHGVLVDVYGVGVLIMGESGIGKSEAALELIKRGHRLVTDDVVEIRKVSDETLVGSAPDITKHFIELRGIGIVDVKSMFGVQSVRETQNIDLVITLEDWSREKEYDRLGLEEEYTEFLGNKVVCHSIPIRPGRNLAIIVESAAVNHRQKEGAGESGKEKAIRRRETMNYCFGVDIGGTTVKMGLFQEDGTIVDKWEIVTDTSEEGKNILPNIASSIGKKIEEHQLNRTEIRGIGVGVPAPVTADGVVNGTANLGWGYKEVRKELENMTGVKAAIGNDANVAALGEMWKGGGAGEKNMIMVTLGTGVGGGVIIDGKILVGQNGAGGEIGHLCVNYEETDRCGCGNRGCLEQYASATGIVRLAKQKLAQEMRPTILNKEDVTAKDVFDAVKAGDEVAREIAVVFGRYLGYGLANLAAVADPAVFVIGGGVSKAGEVLIPYIREPYMERAFFADKNVKFVLAKLGNDAGICGAAKLVLDEQ